jgi:Xaa-Pro aminopeptidase
LKRDLDRLMAERNIDAIVVEGPDGLGGANPDFNYFVQGAHLTGTVFKKRGEAAVLLHSPWEQIQAESTGLALISTNRWNKREILSETGDRFRAEVELRRRIFTDLGIGGRVGFYGTVPASQHFALLTGLAQSLPGLEIVAEFDKDIISQARLTKEPEEIAIMRRVGLKTCAAVQAVVDFIQTGRADGDTLVDASGAAMTIGHVKQLLRRELAVQGLEDPMGTIFAQGRDSGLPHATGDEAAALMLGQSIVFDIYPREQGGGYYHDMTRTFAIGYAPPELQQLYDHVKGAFDQVVSELESGAPTKAYQDMTCAYFEARGHETIGSKYPIEEGYIHSLGHGIGLEVHEDFGFPSLQDRGDILQPGAVFTIEPGLYYPNRGLGVRIEDTYYCTPEGTFESLTPFPQQLVIPLKS